jgi:hypothetical protein
MSLTERPLGWVGQSGLLVRLDLEGHWSFAGRPRAPQRHPAPASDHELRDSRSAFRPCSGGEQEAIGSGETKSHN